VIEGVTGYLVPRSNVAAIRSRIRLLADQPSLRRQMGESARASFHRSFTFDRMYDATVALYREAAGATASPSTPQRAPFRRPALRLVPLVLHAFHRFWRFPWA
jgi:hypothetical protein